MSKTKPDFLKQGERARLFPVLADTSKEGRATSIFLACLANVDEYADRLLGSVGRRIGATSRVRSYTEVCFENSAQAMKGRPDGLIEVKTGKSYWHALVEAKIGGATLSAEQVENYMAIAKANKLNAVITISNQFAGTPSDHPITIRQRGTPIELYHWSWMHLLTEADLLLTNDAIADVDQRVILNEFRRFLTHDSTGVRGFERMPSSWPDAVRTIGSTGQVGNSVSGLDEIVDAWHQEVRDISLILSRQIGVAFSTKLPRAEIQTPALRMKKDIERLKSKLDLNALLSIPEAASDLEVNANIVSRTITVGMKLSAPEDKKGASARINWLIRQVKTENTQDIFVRVHWPRRGFEQYAFDVLKADVTTAANLHSDIVPSALEILVTRRTGARFSQVSNIITDLETIVPEFYQTIGSSLKEWVAPAPRVRDDRLVAEDVTTEAIAEDAENATGSYD